MARKHSRPSAGSRAQVRWVVNRLHVGTPDDEVEADIRKRCSKALDDGKVTNGFVDKMVAVALAEHKRNQLLYTRVTRGI